MSELGIACDARNETTLGLVKRVLHSLGWIVARALGCSGVIGRLDALLTESKAAGLGENGLVVPLAAMEAVDRAFHVVSNLHYILRDATFRVRCAASRLS